MDTVPRISSLSKAVANQIAAGEVIERPMSVVKELLENSIDAAATKIHIDLERTGLNRIRVNDNGQGIHKDDLVLALQPHATSKLKLFSDLAQIASLGFRGEAINSIASVSRFTMTSRIAASDHAWSINNMLEVKPASHNVGTTVEVSDLFFSTPGRRKFLRSEKTEYLRILSLTRAIALGHFQTGLFVRHNEQTVLHLSACPDNPEERVLSICGKTFLNECQRIDIKKGGMRLLGWAGLDNVARSQADRQYLYINGRYIRDKSISHAIRLAYSNRIAPGRFPSFILHLQIDPQQLDINVHPAKTEVRFMQVRDVHDFIYAGLLEALSASQTTLMHEGGPPHLPQEDKREFIQEGKPVNYDNTLFRQTDALEHSEKNEAHLSLGRFLIAFIHQEPYLIDIPAARELITANYLYDRYHADTITRRSITVPVSIPLKREEITFLSERAANVERWGFEFGEIAPDRILVRALPARLYYADVVNLFQSFVALLRAQKPEREIAKRIAVHVNDAGVDTGADDTEQLVREVGLHKTDAGENGAPPWRRLRPGHLASLLKN